MTDQERNLVNNALDYSLQSAVEKIAEGLFVRDIDEKEDPGDPVAGFKEGLNDALVAYRQAKEVASDV